MPLDISNFSNQQYDGDAPSTEDEKQPGLYCIPKCCYPLSAGFVPTQNTIYAVRIVPNRVVYARSIAFVVITPSANNPYTTIGIFDATGRMVFTGPSTNESPNADWNTGLMNSGAGVKFLGLEWSAFDRYTNSVPLQPGTAYYVLFGYGADAAPATLAGIGAAAGSAFTTQAFASAFGGNPGVTQLPELGTMAYAGPGLPTGFVNGVEQKLTYTPTAVAPLLAVLEVPIS